MYDFWPGLTRNEFKSPCEGRRVLNKSPLTRLSYYRVGWYEILIGFGSFYFNYIKYLIILLGINRGGELLTESSQTQWRVEKEMAVKGGWVVPPSHPGFDSEFKTVNVNKDEEHLGFHEEKKERKWFDYVLSIRILSLLSVVCKFRNFCNRNLC